MSVLLTVEILIIILVSLFFVHLAKSGHKNMVRKFLILFLGILLFEFIGEPLWINFGFHNWAYVYRDISWIITLGWCGIFMFTFSVVDRTFSRISETKRFWIYLFFIEAIVVPIESVLITLGVRGYAPILKESLSGFTIFFTSVPIEAIYIIPIFSSLIICFYKYANYIFDQGSKGRSKNV